MGLIIFGHPRSRSNLIASHMEHFPKEIFQLSKINEQSELDWTSNFDPIKNRQSGVAENYLKKMMQNPHAGFKLFGVHLEEWPEVLIAIKSLKYDVLRVYRENKFDAIVSFLIAYRRGFTSFSQKNIDRFLVEQDQFDKAYNIIVTLDDKWKNALDYSATVEYNEIPALIEKGMLTKYGVQRLQVHPLQPQNSLMSVNELIINLDEVKNWFHIKSQKKF